MLTGNDETTNDKDRDEDDGLPGRYRRVKTKTGVFRVANREIVT